MPEPEIVPLATGYLLIQSLAAPCVITEFVSQAFCLANLDTTTPVIAVAVSSLVHIVGDLALSPTWGIQGAAVATALASFTSCMILQNRVRKITLDWKQKQEDEERQLELIPPNGLHETIPFWSLPSKGSLVEFIRLAGPITFFLLGKIACYSITTLRATNFGVVGLATHNIMERVLFFFACFGDSVGQAAESFYPQVAKHEQRPLIWRLLGFSLLLGLCNYICSNFTLVRLGGFLTKEPAILKMMKQYAPYVGISAPVYPVTTFLEGLLLAKRDLKFLAASYTISLVVLFGYIFSPLGGNLRVLWTSLCSFQGILLLQFATRAWRTATKELARMKS